MRQRGGRWRRGGRGEPPAGSRTALPGYARAAGPAPELLSGHDGAAAPELQPGRRLPGAAAAAGVLGAAGGGGGGECGAPSLLSSGAAVPAGRGRGVEPCGELWSPFGIGVAEGGIPLTGAWRLFGRAGVGGEAGPREGLAGAGIAGPPILGRAPRCCPVGPDRSPWAARTSGFAGGSGEGGSARRGKPG